MPYQQNTHKPQGFLKFTCKNANNCGKPGYLQQNIHTYNISAVNQLVDVNI